jgi:hypothetical protein
MLTGPAGEPVSLEERIADVERRYGADHVAPAPCGWLSRSWRARSSASRASCGSSTAPRSLM